VDFGWGSAGKLAAILEALRADVPGVHVTGFATELGRKVLPHGLVDGWSDCDTSDSAALAAAILQAEYAAALVILDPDLAEAVQAGGCPVVYVDSLPYLWTQFDPLPRAVAAYCAQRSLPLSARAQRQLEAVENLHWVDPIVSPALAGAPRSEHRKEPVILVNFGGLHSPQNEEEAAHNYVSSTLPAILEAGRRVGAERAVIAGNLPIPHSPSESQLPLQLTYLDGDQRSFFRWLRKARWVATSPGLTTILEIAALSRAAALLPPQNLSQFHHSRFVNEAIGGNLAIGWPTELLALDDVVAWQETGGETYALERIYRGIGECRRRLPAIGPALVTGCVRALEEANSRPAAFAPLAGSADGARQVVSCITEVTAGHRRTVDFR
jgi:hydroxymethylcytosylglucuronate/cytosylglucuronate synthase